MQPGSIFACGNRVGCTKLVAAGFALAVAFAAANRRLTASRSLWMAGLGLLLLLHISAEVDKIVMPGDWPQVPEGAEASSHDSGQP